MRLFIAIALDEPTHTELAQTTNRLRTAGSDVKWVEPKNIHLTLKFLGEVEQTLLENIKSNLSAVAKHHKQFTIHLAGMGAFPKPSYPRVIWVGIDHGLKECLSIQSDIEDAMQGLGFKKEESEFSCHLTLGRVRSLKNKDQLCALMEKEKDFASSRKALVDKIILFESKLTAKGPIYTPAAEYMLA